MKLVLLFLLSVAAQDCLNTAGAVACPRDLPMCTNDQKPGRLCPDCADAKCCPVCAGCVVCAQNADLPVCAAGVAPVRTCTKCPECRLACTADDFSKCNRTGLPVCNDATRTSSGCCPDCVPPPACPDDKVIACKQNFASLRVCARPEEFRWDFTICCYPCQPPPPPVDQCEKPVESLVSVPDCIEGEPTRAVATTDRCVPPCKTPGTDCDPAQLRPTDAVPPCPVDVKPAIVACRPTCLPPRPTCTGCKTDEKCVQDPRVANAAAFCLPLPTCRTFWIAGLFDGVDPTDPLRLIAERYCENPKNSELCLRHLMNLKLSLRCKKTGNVREKETRRFFEVTCCVAKDDATVGRRLLGSEVLLDGATQAPGTAGSLTFDASAPDPSSATVVSAALGLSALILFF